MHAYILVLCVHFLSRVGLVFAHDHVIPLCGTIISIFLDNLQMYERVYVCSWNSMISYNEWSIEKYFQSNCVKKVIYKPLTRSLYNSVSHYEEKKKMNKIQLQDTYILISPCTEGVPWGSMSLAAVSMSLAKATLYPCSLDARCSMELNYPHTKLSHGLRPLTLKGLIEF